MAKIKSSKVRSVKSKYRITHNFEQYGKMKTYYTNNARDIIEAKNDLIKENKRDKKVKGTISILNPKTNRFKKKNRIGWKRKNF
ncbi:MAG: hypothetical protein K9J13_13825 [Saprospiraceae bacterium]|nr:hypothetical protein [Saprospiraceae bacterium]